jgi:hypothetical protein
MQDLIFISFSKEYTNKVGVLFKSVLDQLYQGKNVTVFLSSKSLFSGSLFREEITKNLKNARCGISILTPENKLVSPWLMYEAGALAIKTQENGGALLPYLFCRDRNDVESPLTQIQAPAYQPDDHDNFKDIIEYFQSLDNYLDEGNRLGKSFIREKITDWWSEYLHGELQFIASNMKDFSASSYGEKKLKSGINESMSLKSLETIEQLNIGLLDNFCPKSPRDIENQFEKILDTQIPDGWKFQNRDEIDYKAHRVLVNSTRFSTFAAFTDGKRIVLFDRKKDKPNTNVYNERFDVFGSVQFENRTIAKKIKSQEFLDAPIERVEEIKGVAIENNIDKRNNERNETVVMLGVCIYMKPENLDLAVKDTVNNEIGIYSLSKMFDFTRESLTSKASLCISHIVSNN